MSGLIGEAGSRSPIDTIQDDAAGSIDYRSMSQAVLGAGGNSGRPLVEALLDEGVSVTAMGRSVDARPFGDRTDYQAVDIMDAEALTSATEGVGVLYVATAVPYNADMWERDWPVVMENVIEAAKTNGSKLVFLDNVFMYGLVDGPMTEATPFNPMSRKGEVRAQIADSLQAAMESGEVTATIGRSADFYGPNTSIGFRFFAPAIKGEPATWLGKLGVPRTFSSLADNGRALAVLGNDARADNKVWHLPAAAARDGHYFVDLTERILGREVDVALLSGEAMQAEARRTGEPVQEAFELMYQYDFPYVFDSGRFEKVFGLEPTPYEVGFRQVIDAMRAGNEQ